MVLGSSCLWNHIMYLVWNRHDCFFSALAARYCAFVPWGGRGSGASGDPPDARGKGDGQGIRADPGPRHRPRMGWTLQLEPGGGTEHTSAARGKGDRRWECFRRSLEKEETLTHEECLEAAASVSRAG